MDKVVKAYLDLLADEPNTEVPLDVLMYHFHSCAIDRLDKRNQRQLQRQVLEDLHSEDYDSPCPKRSPKNEIRMSTGGVSMNR